MPTGEEFVYAIQKAENALLSTDAVGGAMAETNATSFELIEVKIAWLYGGGHRADFHFRLRGQHDTEKAFSGDIITGRGGRRYAQ